MRKIIEQAKNGQPVNEVATWNDLSSFEKERLNLPYGDQPTDYQDFNIRHNKKGHLLTVRGKSLTTAKNKAIDKAEERVNILDIVNACDRHTNGSVHRHAVNKLKQNHVYHQAKVAYQQGLFF